MNKQTVTSQSPKLQLSKKSKDASSSSKEEESSLTKNVKKQYVIQASKKSKDASSSSKEEESPLKKNVEKQSVISKSSKLQASKKSKDAFSSLNEIYSILESPLRRKENKQIVLASFHEESILLQSLKRSTPKKTKFNIMSLAKGNKKKNSIQINNFWCFIRIIFMCFTIMVDYFSLIKYISLVTLLC